MKDKHETEQPENLRTPNEPRGTSEQDRLNDQAAKNRGTQAPSNPTTPAEKAAAERQADKDREGQLDRGPGPTGGREGSF